ncbi:Holliday junction branch migration protein RuvA [Mycoplasma marinum]|uniref:Holliday junction branch migration complex subunit RuvA n=1 Tax=Mycoplasma marinum TaxID=1937190 RepID=A0A4R0XMH4_9MOLU|nr:Holliday junction branch migration protein RuvA [Mycoplasma marinum]TCG11737.1 Holliday junction branch migration protein RuvA [Mycoplasma marinum]
MILYKIGKIISIGKQYIILESNFIGEVIYVPKPRDFIAEKVLKIFIYEYKYENHKTLYGFKTFKERILFEDLLTVPGIGPKTGIQILKERIKKIIGMLLKGDADGLAHLPGLGVKSAKQMIFELQDKYSKLISNEEKKKMKNESNLISVSEIIPTLKTLGFSKQQIKLAINKVKSKDNIELMIEDAIRVISNEKHKIIKA